MIIDESRLRKTIAVMKPDGQLFEVRIVYNSKITYSGYFRDADTLIAAIDRDIRDFSGCNFYITLNTLDDACYAREQKERFVRGPKASTSDRDVVGYDWLFIDLDPVRPAGTSSTDKQLRLARDAGNRVYQFMRQLGFNKPLMAYSGNGVHLMYKVYMDNTEDNKKLIETSLKTLDMLFSDKDVQVDVKNSNPARVCKLYGTLAQKGSDTKDFPHRMSEIINGREPIEVNAKAYLEKLCERYPKEEKPQQYNNYRPRDFDLDEWLNRYGIRYEKTTYSGGTKYILEECPFDSNHKGKDACIFKSTNGAIGFHCFHNGCAEKKWQDVRLLYEPDAYEKRQQENEKRMYGRFNRDHAPVHIVEKPESPIFLTAKDIFDRPEEPATYIRTGIDIIDRRMRGLAKGDVSLVSGLRASAKSTLLTQWILDAVQAGNTVGCFSGELRDKRFMRWMYQIAAGKGYVEPSKYEGYYTVPRKYQERINTWLGDRFWLYDNAYGNDFNAVIEQFEKAIEDKKLDLLILDNLMAFDIRSLSDNKFEAQTQFILKIVDLAKSKNVHIVFVAHPRKALGFLRLDDVSGSADLANAVDNAFIIHRNNNDFQRLSKAMFGWGEDNDAYAGTNAIEIAKDRDGGTQDVFIPLYYEPQSKRLKNSITENKQYGWLDVEKAEDGFIDVDDMAEIPF